MMAVLFLHTPVPRLILPLGCHRGFGYLASSFPAPRVWSFLLPTQTVDPWKIKDNPHLTATSPWNQEQPPLENQAPPLLGPLHTLPRARWEPRLPPVSFLLTPESSTFQLRQPFSQTDLFPSHTKSQVLVTVAGTLRFCTKSWGHSQT